jgi:hypothetical protein
MSVRIGCIVIVTGLIAAPASGQMVVSRCADCHLASATPPEPDHVIDWERSPHGRNQVGCEKCHGGDSSSFEPFRAHQGILNSRNPASPVHPRNLSKTCGTCHPGPFVAFQKSRHFALHEQMQGRVPTCTTCHEQVAARMLSPKALERQCNACHGEGKVAPRAERASNGRAVLEQIEDVRASLTAVRRVLDRMPRGERRSALEESWEQAEVPLVQSVHDSHAFVFESALERIAVARQRIDTLMHEFEAK